MVHGRSICLLLGVAADGDGVGVDWGGGGGDGDGVGGGGADEDVLAHLVKPKGEQMKPSYKFKWCMGDQYARRWSAEFPSVMGTVMGTEMGTEMGTVTEWETEMVAETATHWRVWSSRKIST